MLKTSAIAMLLGFMMCTLSCKKKDTLKGIDTDALFATPTTEELNSIEATIRQRNLVPADAKIEETHEVSPQLTVHIISFRLYGHKQYAGVLVPTSAKPLPVQVYISGFGLDMPYSMQNIKTSAIDSPALPFVYVVPALRGQWLSLTVNDVTYTTPQSEGTRNDAFDGAADDGIAAINAVGSLFSQADTSIVITRGGSRGGTVALLMAERDTRIKRAVGVAFPTDLLGLTPSHQNDPTYKFQFLDALTNGTATLEETRRKMIASSPIYFSQRLPKTQAHFGELDKITEPAQGTLLKNKMEQLGIANRLDLFIYPGREHSNIATGNTELEARIRALFAEVLE